MADDKRIAQMMAEAKKLDTAGYTAAAELKRLEAGQLRLMMTAANGIRTKKDKPSRSKYGNKTSHRDGHKFDSAAELRRYIDLKHLLNVGEIDSLDAKPAPIELLPKSKDEAGKPIRAVTYAPDFIYTIEDVTYIEDVKGVETAAFRIKWNMLRRYIAEKVRREGGKYKLIILPSDQT